MHIFSSTFFHLTKILLFQVLESFKIMDYSLLVGVHNVSKARNEPVIEEVLTNLFSRIQCSKSNHSAKHSQKLENKMLKRLRIFFLCVAASPSILPGSTSSPKKYLLLNFYACTNLYVLALPSGTSLSILLDRWILDNVLMVNRYLHVDLFICINRS